jgi:hypothetical protein
MILLPSYTAEKIEVMRAREDGKEMATKGKRVKGN